MRYLLLFCITLLASGCGTAEESTGNPATLQLETLAEGLRHPWSLAFLPDGGLLITERAGQLQHFRDGSLSRISGVPEVLAEGQGGLFDVLLHPQFSDNGQLYLSFAGACADGGSTTRIVRATLDQHLEQHRLTDVQPIFAAAPCASKAKHFGGRLVIDQHGFLFLTLGDRGERERSQEGQDHNGSIIRLHDDGRIPEDNPHVGDPSIANAIWSMGHRNPQGLALHPRTGALWSQEHGPRGGDEINLIEPGNNYGWPEVTFGREYYGPKIGVTQKDDMTDPLKHWTPSIAPSGMAFYQGEEFADWQGDILIGALAGKHLTRVRFDGLKEVSEQRYLEGKARIRDVRIGPDGLIYLLTDATNGALWQLRPDRREQGR